MPDPFKNTVGIPVGQDAENLALTVSRSGALRSGAGRSGFIGSPGDTPDLHDIGTDGSVVGAGYGWRDRYLPPPSHFNQAPTLTAPSAQQIAVNSVLVFNVAHGNALSMADSDANGGIEELDLLSTQFSGVFLPGAQMNLVLASLTGITITAGANSTPHMTIRGTLAAINNAIDGLSITMVAASNGQVYLITLTANDLGNTGAGGPLTATKAISVLLQIGGL